MRIKKVILQAEPSENQMLRFPGNERQNSSREAEVREDIRLLAEIAAGNQSSLAALYRRRGGMLYSLLMRMLNNETEAQEVMQDTFTRIWRRAEDYDPVRSSPLTWMVMIARGHALDRLRAQSRRDATRAAYEREMASLEIEVNHARSADRDELAAACALALNNLPEPQGQALQLAFFRGWTHAEIATASGEPLGTVKARIRRGLLGLRKALKDYYV